MCTAAHVHKSSRPCVWSVDVATDAMLQATVRRTFADATVLAIAHRINTIMVRATLDTAHCVPGLINCAAGVWWCRTRTKSW